jgi:hypothetical protein
MALPRESGAGGAGGAAWEAPPGVWDHAIPLALPGDADPGLRLPGMGAGPADGGQRSRPGDRDVLSLDIPLGSDRCRHRCGSLACTETYKEWPQRPRCSMAARHSDPENQNIKGHWCPNCFDTEWKETTVGMKALMNKCRAPQRKKVKKLVWKRPSGRASR